MGRLYFFKKRHWKISFCLIPDDQRTFPEADNYLSPDKLLSKIIRELEEREDEKKPLNKVLYEMMGYLEKDYVVKRTNGANVDTAFKGTLIYLDSLIEAVQAVNIQTHPFYVRLKEYIVGNKYD